LWTTVGTGGAGTVFPSRANIAKGLGGGGGEDGVGRGGDVEGEGEGITSASTIGISESGISQSDSLDGFCGRFSDSKGGCERSMDSF